MHQATGDPGREVEAEPYEGNVEERTCSPNIGFRLSGTVIELIRRVYSEISEVTYINHLFNERFDL